MKDISVIDSSIKRSKSLMQAGQFGEAQSELESALSDNPEHLEVLYCLAVCQRKQSFNEEADATLQHILALEPKHSHAYQEIGHNALATDNQIGAIEAFEEAVNLNPALHGAWRVLSNMQEYPRVDEARRQLAWLSSLPPELVSVASFIHQEKLHKAETLCRQFLKRQPHHPEAMRLLAQLGLKFQILDDAEFLLEKCLEFKPDHLHARLDYVEVLHRRQKFPKALEQAKLLHDFDPQNPGFEISLANAQQANGDYRAAEKSYRNAISKAPNNASVHVALGNALKTSGKTQDAIDAYQNAYGVQGDFGDAYWSLANLKTYKFSDFELRSMREQLASSRISKLDRARVNFALGKAYEDLGDFDTSFMYYEQGNAIKAAENRFDLDRLRAELSYQKDHFDSNFFNSRSDYGCTEPDPIFVVGLPRAGSTLLEQILASHSQIDGTMELANVIAYANQLNGRVMASETPKYPAVLNKLTKEQCKKLGETYLEETKAHRLGAALFIDKMPNNFRHIALIKLILPNAKIIDARRDPMACCFSGYKQLFAEGQEFSYSLSHLGSYYCEYVDLMRHWEQALPGHVLKVQHEDVLDDLEGQVGRMLEFCGLDFERACVEFHKSKRAVRTPSSEQVRQPIFKTAVEHWRNYEGHLDPLRLALSEL